MKLHNSANIVDARLGQGEVLLCKKPEHPALPQKPAYFITMRIVFGARLLYLLSMLSQRAILTGPHVCEMDRVVSTLAVASFAE